MDVKIPKEIRDYQESIFFGLSLRQFFFSVVAMGVAVLLYFVLKDAVGTETVSWLCILCAAPFAVLGFFRYHGMTFEKFAWTWIKAELLMPKRLVFQAVNIYYEVAKTNPKGEKAQ